MQASDMSEAAVRQAFHVQALFCDRSGAPLTAAVLRAIQSALDHTTETGRRTLGWIGDPSGSADSVPLRLAGGFHALARRGIDAQLSRLYAGDCGDADEIVARTIYAHDADLLPWLDSPPQTNEVGRAAPVMAGLLMLAAEHGFPFEPIELGASAGLNLNLDRFGYRLGDVEAGELSSSVKLAPRWDGPSPAKADVHIVSRKGVDRSPIRVADPAAKERLIAYCWPDQPERMQRLQAALTLADRYPPLIQAGDAADFAERALAEPQAPRTCRVVFHTIFWSYLPPDKQGRIRAALDRAGAGATADHPLAWLRYELNEAGTAAELWLRTWPGGRDRCLATGHPHGNRICWQAD